MRPLYLKDLQLTTRQSLRLNMVEFVLGILPVALGAKVQDLRLKKSRQKPRTDDRTQRTIQTEGALDHLSQARHRKNRTFEPEC
jgi:hypothetical protein